MKMFWCLLLALLVGVPTKAPPSEGRRYKTVSGSALTEAEPKFGTYKNMLRITPGLSDGAQHAAPLQILAWARP